MTPASSSSPRSRPSPTPTSRTTASRTSYYFESETAAGLAEQIGVPPDALEQILKEVDRIAAGEARDPFGRDGFGPRPSRGRPFHAIGPLSIFMGSTGGLRVDANMRVLDTLRRSHRRDCTPPG